MNSARRQHLARGPARFPRAGWRPERARRSTKACGSAAAGSVRRAATSDSGQGVYGYATSSTGTTYGAFGEASSPEGTGVRGYASATKGDTEGVYGSVHSPDGEAVQARNHATTGLAYGVHGRTGSSAGFGVFAQGKLGATGSKSFIQPHPKDPSKNINFICLEGNENGTYFRGKGRLVNGRAEIDIPEEWKLVTDAQGITVQVSTIRSLGQITVMEQSRSRIIVIGTEDCEFNYFVNGVRRGFTKYEPYETNHGFKPDVRGVPFGSQYPKALRDILVGNGILNADYTPNEATAARLGWKLKDKEDVSLAERWWLTAAEREAQRPVSRQVAR